MLIVNMSSSDTDRPSGDAVGFSISNFSTGIDRSWCRRIHLPSLHWLFEDIYPLM